MFRFLRSLFAGLFTGAILGVLFAPKKGAETRKHIKEKGIDGVKDVANEMGDDFQELYADLSEDERVKKGVAQAKKYHKKARKKAKELYVENVDASDRKKIKETVKKAKKSLDSAHKKLNKKK